MPLRDLSDPGAVREAVTEYDRLGREGFHQKYGFADSLRYPLLLDGKQYPSKAIAAVAYQIQYPDRPRLTEEKTQYSGGLATVVPQLRELGFEILDEKEESSRVVTDDLPEQLHDVLEEVLSLQPKWDSLNTPEMERRGLLVRRAGAAALRSLLPPSGLPPHDLDAEGRDGTGRKTRIPWMRVFSGAASPSATQGWYISYLFAADGSSVALSLNQGSTTMEDGQFKTKPEAFIRDRVHWARELLGDRLEADPRFVKEIDLHDSNVLAKAYERSHVVGIEYEAGAVPSNEDLQKDLLAMLPLLASLYEAESEAPIPSADEVETDPWHLLLKWRSTYEPATVLKHKEVAEAKGSVWWGVFTSSDASKVGAVALATLRAQLASGVITRVWLSGPSELPVWKTVLSDISEQRPEDEDERIPAYYPSGVKHKIWLKLSSFEETNRDWLLSNLEPVAQPGNLLTLGNQTNPLYVRERSHPRVWWVNQGSSYQRAKKGGYLWAPIKNKQGQELPHWATMKYLRKGDVVLHYANTQIRAVGRVMSEAKASSRPDEQADQAWNDEGRRAEVSMRDISPPVRLMDIPQEWRRKEGRPFNSDGGVTQGYLFAVSDDFAKRLNNQFPQLKLHEEVDLEVTAPVQPIPADAFDVATLKDAAVDKGLILEDETYASLIAALESGKHVILTGPPGTAKTTLAEVVAGVASRAGRCEGYLLTTATADWTTYETIGGLKPDPQEGLSFAPGHFLEAIDKNHWLVIDELNRSNFDRAFGQLFTVLSGQAVELPYERKSGAGRILLMPEAATRNGDGLDVLPIPASWRVVATMNVFDKSLLFEMSFALMRRFAFVEVPAPPDPVFHSLLDQEAAPDQVAAALAKKFLVLRRFKDLGPAMFMDLARFFRVRREVAVVSEEDLAFEGFYAFMLPQFEGIEMVTGENLFKEVRRLVGTSNRERLRTTLNSVLGLDLAGVSPPDENDDTYDSGLEPPTSE